MSNMAGIIIRNACAVDVAQLVQLRRQLWQEVGEPIADDPLIRATEAAFEKCIASEKSLTVVACDGPTVIAVGTGHLMQRLPYAGNISGQELYVLNMYTLPSYRCRGLASKILQHLIDFARGNDVGRIWLHASSEEGQSVYKKAGFTSRQSEMELKFKTEAARVKY